jgi:hypothetical protein
LIDAFPPEAREKQITVVKDNIEWARNESRVFLRQSLEVKLIGLYVPACSSTGEVADGRDVTSIIGKSRTSSTGRRSL